MGVSFDNVDGFIWFDGKLVPWKDANVHVLTHGLHYASCVFEGERAYGGKVFRSTEHSGRLKRSANILDFEIPFSVAEIDAAKARRAGYRVEAGETLARGGPVRASDEELGMIKTDDTVGKIAADASQKIGSSLSRVISRLRRGGKK